MTDPRRKLIAEAMEAHDGEAWRRNDKTILLDVPDDIVEVCGVATWQDARSIALSHNALPVAAELIEELTAEVERLNERFSKLAEAVQIAIYADAIAEWQDEEGDGLKSVYREVTND